MEYNANKYTRWNHKIGFHYDLSARHRAVVVLVTEDAAYAEMVKPVLVTAGFEVRVVGTERDASCITFSILPDLMLVDRRLCEGSGEAVMWRLKNQPHLSKIPVYLARQAAAGQILGANALARSRLEAIS